jgi:hypothetical protein
VWFPNRKFPDPRNIGLEFSDVYEWKLLRQTLYGFEDAVIEVSKHPQEILGLDIISKIERCVEG